MQELTGAWDVQFDPQWYYGSDGLRVTSNECKLVLETLVNWTKRPEAAVKYYSGIATYRRAAETTELLPSGLLGPVRVMGAEIP